MPDESPMSMVCARCGSSEFIERDDHNVCIYCQSRYALARTPPETTIGLISDVEALLQKCIDDPSNRRRYAHLVLDLDPTNRQARDYLR